MNIKCNFDCKFTVLNATMMPSKVELSKVISEFLCDDLGVDEADINISDYAAFEEETDQNKEEEIKTEEE